MDQITPKKVGVIKNKGEDDVVHLKYLGDRYTKAISQGIEYQSQIQKIILQNNKITDIGIKNILPSLKKQIKVLDLSGNQFGTIGCELIASIFDKRNCELQNFKINDNFLGSQKINIIMDGILKNKTLQILDLSKNYITNQSVPAIAQIIQSNSQLKELYLHWNLIKGEGGIQIFESLKDNTNIKVLDISWNSLGNGNASCQQQIIQFFKQNKTMVHLDLSNNNFTYEECQSISENLNQFNQTLYGLHFNGNYGLIDNLGFLKIKNQQKDMTDSHAQQRINSVQSINFYKKKDTEGNCNYCWVCDGWQEQVFQWKPSLDDIDQPLFIHFEFENFQAVYLGKIKNQNYINYNKMLPLKEDTRYFFTCNWKQVINEDAEWIENNPKEDIRLTLVDQDLIINLDRINVIRKRDSHLEVFGPNYFPQISIKPRMRQLRFKKPKGGQIKQNWNVSMSIFKDWKKDNDEMLIKCVEDDWNNSKLNKIVKSDEQKQKIKDILTKNYTKIKDTYKFYASINPIGEIWAIQTPQFNELIKVSNIVNDKLTEADITLKWTATISGNPKGNPRMPDRGMVRCQFFESIVRLADDKFLKSKECLDIESAVEKILNEHFKPELDKYNHHEWREKVLWTQKNDMVLKHFKGILEYLYKSNSSKKVKPGQKNFMCLEELIDICDRVLLFDDQFTQRDVQFAFNLSMMTQFDEITNDRIYQMSFIEFVESIGRIANKKLLDPIGNLDDDLGFNRNGQVPIHIKIEALMHRLYNLCDNQTKKAVKLPQQSLFIVEQIVQDSDGD